MSVFILREYWKYPFNSEEGVENVFYLDQDYGFWIDPLMIQVERAFALERAMAEHQPAIIDDEQVFYRLDWLKMISGAAGAKRLEKKLVKIIFKQPGELVRTIDQTMGVLGNDNKNQ